MALTLVVWPVQGSAQRAASQEEGRRLESGAGKHRQMLDAADEAVLLRPLQGGEEILYEQVLQDPDNVTLNFLYAQSQVRKGELRGAAATLERILLLHSELHTVRLFYAMVLYRLDSLEEARRQLERLAGSDLAPSQLAEVERYLGQITSSTRATRVKASLSFASHFDSNRNAAPRSGTSLIQLGTGPGSRLELDLTSDSREQDDVGFFSLMNLKVEHDLGFQEGHMLEASVSTYLSHQIDVTDFNTRAYAVNVGGLYRGRHADVKPRIYGALVELSSETFLKTVGLDLKAERALSPAWKAEGGLKVEWQDFDPIRQSVTSNEHTGLQLDAEVGTGWRLNPVHHLHGRFGWRYKDARGSSTPGTNDVFSYLGPRAALRHTWLLGRGQFLMTSLTGERDSYRRHDFRISTKRRRRDTRLRAGVLYGAPVATLLPVPGVFETLGELLVTANVEYSRVWSNLPNYDFDNAKVALVFTRNWSF